jgi:hypothetical protein
MKNHDIRIAAEIILDALLTSNFAPAPNLLNRLWKLGVKQNNSLGQMDQKADTPARELH